MLVERLVFLGDYVNRGGESRQVVEFLIDLSTDFDCIFLAGNHDRAFYAALNGQFDEFLTMGGAATVRSYIRPPFADVESEFGNAVPLRHREFLSTLRDEFVIDELRVSHQLPPANRDGRFRVCGHSPQPSTVPLVLSDRAFIDTGCGTLSAGVLTCFLWPAREFLSQPDSGG